MYLYICIYIKHKTSTIKNKKKNNKLSDLIL